METEQQAKHLVAVIGAGPAGLYAAKHLAAENIEVVIFNRDIRPGGLAEYGIYPTKLKMKDGLRAQFRQILASPGITYYGNVQINARDDGDLTFTQLRSMGFEAFLVTTGAQGTKTLGLPGETLNGVYHAKDVCFHYNQLPPFSERNLEIGKRIAVVGVGNVALDMTHWLVEFCHVDEVTVVARRGPAEVKFDKKELEWVISNLDLATLDAEIARVTPAMKAVDENPEEARAFIYSALEKAPEKSSSTRFQLAFLQSPVQILGDASGHVTGLEVEENELYLVDGEARPRGTGIRRIITVDSVIFAIGDRVDDKFGLPVMRNEYMRNPNPRFPVEGISYEVNGQNGTQELEDVFVAGWSRQASTGLVGVARKDGTNGAKAVLQYLAGLPERSIISTSALADHFAQLNHPVVVKEDLQHLYDVEANEALRRGLITFKFGSNREMLEAIQRQEA